MSFYISFFKKSVFFSFLQLLPALAGIIVLKIYSAQLTREEFAVLAMLTTVSNLSFIINSLCLDQVITRFYYEHFRDEQRLSNFFATIITTVISLLGLLILIVFLIPEGLNALLFKGLLNEFRWQFIAAIMVGFGLSLNKIALSFFRNEQKYSWVFLIVLFTALLQVILVWFGIEYMPSKVMGAQLGKFFGILLPTAFIIANYFFHHKARLVFGMIKEVVPFFIPLIFYSILYWGVTQFDQFVFQLRLKDLDTLALYVMAFNIALFADLVLNGLSSFIVPELNLIMKSDGNRSRISNFIHLFVLIACISVFMISFAGEILINFYLDPKYSNISWIVNGLLIGYLFRMLYVIYSFPIYFHKNTSSLAFILLFVLILSITANWLLIPALGIFSMILTSVMTRSLQTVLVAYRSKKFTDLPFNRWKTFGLTVIFGFFLLILMIVTYKKFMSYYLAFGLLSFVGVISVLVLFRKQMPMLISGFKEKLSGLRNV